MDCEPEPPPSNPAKRKALGEFIPALVVPPREAPHHFTVIFLHGRGYNAKDSYGPLLSTPVTGDVTFQQSLAHARFVFPTAPLMRASKYRRSVIHQWYDGTGDWEPEARGDMRPSVEHIHGLIRDEMALVGGDAKRIVLAGFSQGCAMALTCMLLWEGEPLGAVVGMCGFVPVYSSLMDVLNEDVTEESGDDGGIVFEVDGDDAADDTDRSGTPLQRAVRELRKEVELPELPSPSNCSFLETPVFLGHGTKDTNVDQRHAREAAALLTKMGLGVEFETYRGLEHWYSPEMLGHIQAFLATRMKSSQTDADTCKT
ncbi:acyl-CoA N-acyltransferase [Purpureocillium lavendulum]|uniref:Acyl-CoA N-acyltransferase n=1 Tax=Purpureocillium lavendulum TaxID=1247861 RepID=A0AB34FKL7_9HYPO|nr:acyl-CoA N-acyltransferase [Purpureocillium lavendulum]